MRGNHCKIVRQVKAIRSWPKKLCLSVRNAICRLESAMSLVLLSAICSSPFLVLVLRKWGSRSTRLSALTFLVAKIYLKYSFIYGDSTTGQLYKLLRYIFYAVVLVNKITMP